MAAIGGERVVKERLKDVVEKIPVLAVLAPREAPEEIVRPRAPLLALLNAEPALLLDEVQEDDLSHELLGEIRGLTASWRTLVAIVAVFPLELVQLL